MPIDLTVTCLALLALGVALFVAIYPEQAPIDMDEEED